MKSNINKIFLTFIVSFLLGVFITNILFDTILSIIILMFLIVFLLNIYLHITKNSFFIIFIVVWLILWTFYTSYFNENIKNKQNTIESFYDKESYIVWKVIDIYKINEYWNSYIVEILSINEEQNFDFNFLLRLSPNFYLEKNQIIWLKTKIDKVDRFDPNFDYEKFLILRNIYFVVQNTNIELIEKKPLSKVDNIIIPFRQRVLEIISSMYPKNEASFLSWILVWERNNIPTSLSISYNNSWLTHFISISWFHISIIIIFLGFLFAFMPPYLRAIFILIFVVFFILIVWFKVPAIRASIMWIVWYYILLSWRDKNTISLLLFTAFLFVLYNPLYLNYDVSFHLSFLAVLGILYTKDFWGRIFFFLPSFLAIKQSFILTMWAMTATLPIVMINFWQFNVFSPIANMLVWGIMPFLMLFWFISIIFELVFDKLGFYLWFLVFLLLRFINEVAMFFGNLDFWIIKYDFLEYGVYIQIVYLIILFFFIIFFNIKKTPN